MFEHFTEHARRVLDLEGQEAQKLHHEYLGTEHLLLALIHEPEGHGHQALENLGICHKQVRQTISELVEEGPDTDVPDGFRLTPRIKHVMEMATQEARELKHGHIGTEHLLLALLCEPEGVALQALQKMGFCAKDVRSEVLRLLEQEQVA